MHWKEKKKIKRRQRGRKKEERREKCCLCRRWVLLVLLLSIPGKTGDDRVITFVVIATRPASVGELATRRAQFDTERQSVRIVSHEYAAGSNFCLVLLFLSISISFFLSIRFSVSFSLSFSLARSFIHFHSLSLFVSTVGQPTNDWLTNWPSRVSNFTLIFVGGRRVCNVQKRSYDHDWYQRYLRIYCAPLLTVTTPRRIRGIRTGMNPLKAYS